jgi:hypothetical protein
MSKLARRWCSAAVLFACLSVAVFAYNGGSTYVVEGNGGRPLTGVWITSSWSEGATYAKVRLVGLSGYCWWADGSSGGYCYSNGSLGIGWESRVEMIANSTLYGCATGEGYAYVNNQVVQASTGSACFPPPGGCESLNGGGVYYEWNGTTCVEISGSPIVIATGKARNYKLTGAGAGVLFDLDGNGTAEQIAWTEADSEVAFLALDRNGNGQIDNGRELFGNFTVEGKGNGFEALRALAGGAEQGSVSDADPVFRSLLLWHDRNHNGVSESGELAPAADTLEAIGLGYTLANRRDGNGNTYRFEGWARKRFEDAATASSENIVWGTSAVQRRAESAPAREFKIYDVFFQ